MAHTVDAETNTACRRHTDLQCVQEIFVGVVCFLVACVCQSILLLETLSLIDRVIQLGVSVAPSPSRS